MMKQIKRNDAYNFINDVCKLGDDNNYIVQYSTVYYKDEEPITVRRSTFDNIPTDLSMKKALMIVRCSVHYIFNGDDWDYSDTELETYSIV